jgi:hypothetical protein
MSMARSLALALVILAVLGAVPLHTAYALQREGSTLEAQDDAEVMDTIPVGVLANSSVVDVVARGDRVVVLEVKNIPTVVRTDQWLRVRVLATDAVGWVYNGSPGSRPNFVPI